MAVGGEILYAARLGRPRFAVTGATAGVSGASKGKSILEPGDIERSGYERFIEILCAAKVFRFEGGDPLAITDTYSAFVRGRLATA